MKDMNKAERAIWKAAQGLISAKRGKNEFVSVEYAKGAFDMACEMALALAQTTDERIMEIEAAAIKKIY